ncbi:MAG: flagellar hook-basal body protein [Armatimonadetes bacterium]|nr:flagellar hook-basal body protein [Armatimonadota bacterium]
MTRGMYAAAGGMLVGMRAGDVYANNLANASTTGYKADRVSFGSFQRVMLPSVKDGTGAIAQIAQSSTVNPITVDLTQGAIQETSNPLDIAIDGGGFLVVGTPAGERYTRDGHLTVDGAGQLVTGTGETVLSIANAPITVGNGSVSIHGNGEVFSNNQLVGQLRLVSLTDPANALKEGGNLISGGSPVNDTKSQVRQGMLESSNADTMRTMVEMIQTLRLVEMNQRVIQAQDSTLQQIIDVARK